MKIYNNDNTRLIEIMQGLENGQAINQTFRGNSYEFYKENNNVLVRLEGDTVGHLFTTQWGTFEQLGFEDWDANQYKSFEWLDEVDAYLIGYEV
ncbi:hypothetical protein [Staphylococcus phage VB-SauS-SA2]|nr:hypothetical protein [Staphylococcus phage VB-SauS-SA2]